jgi:hypothetical protein
MKPFTTFLHEEKLSENELSRVLKIFEKAFFRYTKLKLYRYGGPDGEVDVKNGKGILYFYGKGVVKALRLNIIQGTIDSLTLWKKFKMDEPGDFTIDLGGLTLLQGGKVIFDHILNPKQGMHPTYGEILEHIELTEAKRITPHEFHDLVKAKGGNVKQISWEDLGNIAIAADVQIPTIVRSLGSGKGADKRFDLTKLLSNPTADDLPKQTQPDYYIKITAQDSLSKKFLSVKDDKKAADILDRIKDSLENPSPEVIKQEAMDADTKFGRMASLVKVVSRGAKNSLVITGGAGIGKSYVVTETVKTEGLTKGQDYFVIKGKITTASLYQTLFMHRHGALLIFDDCDSVWNDQDSANILKAALDSYDVRTISWISARTVNVSRMSDDDKKAFNDNLDLKIAADPDDRSIKFPSEFDYEGKIIFISNLKMKDMDDAVLNRSAKIDMDITQEQIIQRLETLLPNLGDPDVPLDAKKEILGFLKEQFKRGKMKSLSMRTFVGAEGFYKSGLPEWRELIEFG